MSKIRGSCTFNPLTPRNAQHVNSPHIFNEMSFTQVWRMKIIVSSRGVILIQRKFLWPPNRNSNVGRTKLINPGRNEFAKEKWDLPFTRPVDKFCINIADAENTSALVTFSPVSFAHAWRNFTSQESIFGRVETWTTHVIFVWSHKFSPPTRHFSSEHSFAHASM